MIRFEAEVEIAGQRLRVPVVFDEAALEVIAAALPVVGKTPSPSPYMTIPEAAEYLRCERHRIDDLLSQRRLTRYKDGSRTLVCRQELEQYVANSGHSRRGVGPSS